MVRYREIETMDDHFEKCGQCCWYKKGCGCSHPDVECPEGIWMGFSACHRDYFTPENIHEDKKTRWINPLYKSLFGKKEN